MKALFVLPFAILLGAASTPPPEVQTGRSIAVEKPAPKYWLSNDLNRLFLQKPETDAKVSAPRGREDAR